MVLGYFEPADGDVEVQVPLEVDEYIQMRLAEVFEQVSAVSRQMLAYFEI
jgi:hypothetical protein